jgi:hypothetical protein
LHSQQCGSFVKGDHCGSCSKLRVRIRYFGVRLMIVARLGSNSATLYVP